MADTSAAYAVLKKHWGYDEFRPCQLDIIQSVLDGHDTLGLMPTGGGKSITFQVPAMILPGLTVVVSPLISLMKDQVDNLSQRGIRAAYLCTGLSRREFRLACDRCRLGKAKILYVAPERLRNQAFIDELRTWDVSMMVVDEAHCISQWGYDFRPSYLKIADLRKALRVQVPVLALTASATERVRGDIRDRLNFGADSRTFTLSFARPNINYVVRYVDSKAEKLLDVLTKTTGTAIVYVRSRVKTRQIAEMLQAAGISATYYHAGLDPEVKADCQERWKTDRVRVIVATNAFGMGIDKPDVRVVVHMDCPPSLEEYYQEAGRAGRDGKPSFAVMLASDADKALLTRRLNEAFPPLDYVRRVYELAGNFMSVAVGEGYGHAYEFDVDKFCTVFKLQAAPVRGALSLLTQAGYFEFEDQAQSRSRVMILCRRDELYGFRLSPDAEAVLLGLLREYSGLFADYVFVSETRIAAMAGVGTDQVYPAMLELQRQGILHYVPKKAIPYVYYTTSRELPKYVELSPEVYENRRQLMKERLDAVRAFVFGQERCRARVILEYFGEHDAGDCGCCDVCRSRRRSAVSRWADDPEAILTAAMRVVSGYPQGISFDDLSLALRLQAADLVQALRVLVERRFVCLSGKQIRLTVQ